MKKNTAINATTLLAAFMALNSVWTNSDGGWIMDCLRCHRFRDAPRTEMVFKTDYEIWIAEKLVGENVAEKLEKTPPKSRDAAFPGALASVLREMMRAWERGIEKRRGGVKYHEAEIEGKRSRIESAMQSIKECEAIIKDIDARREEIEAENGACKTYYLALESEEDLLLRTNLKELYEKACKGVDGRIAENREEIEKRTAEIEKCKEEIVQAEKKIEDLQKKIPENEEALDCLIKMSESDLSKLVEEIKKTQAIINMEKRD